MPLETATYIPDLVTSNPAHSDGMNNTDSHIRMIKGVLKATFANFTDAALSSTQAQLDSAASAVNTNGVAILADAGVHFKTNTLDGLTNPAAGEVDIVATNGATPTPAQVAIAKFKGSDKSVAFQGPVSATGVISGPGVTPVGGTVLWWDDTLPADGCWVWANGGALSRTAYPQLFAKWGTKFGAGDGSTTFNVPDMREVTPVGKSTMGGAPARGLLANITTSLLTTVGSLFGVATNTLNRSDLPNVAPTFTGTQAYLSLNGNRNYLGTDALFGGVSGGGGTGYAANGGSTGISTPTASGYFTPSGTVQSLNGGVTQTAVNNVQPSTTVNWIIRAA
mgnify:CR=1 FL=1